MSSERWRRAALASTAQPPLSVQIRLLPHFGELEHPSYAYEGSAGMDLRAALTSPVQVAAGKTSVIPTGLAIALPEGYEAQVRSRSGLAARNHLFVLNSPGTIDCGYTGEIKVILANFSETSFTIERGMRVAQLVVCPVTSVKLDVVETFADYVTARGSRGFGSSGLT